MQNSHSENEDEKAFECKICSEKFYLKIDLNKHNALKHSFNRKKPFQCESCAESFSYIFMLRSHVNEEHGKTNSDATNVESDIKLENSNQNKNQNLAVMHQVPESTQVKEPSFQFGTIYYVHSEDEDENAFECEICRKRFYIKGELTKHHALKHAFNLKKLFQCNSCDHSFFYECTLKRHLNKEPCKTNSQQSKQNQHQNQNLEVIDQIPESTEEPSFQSSNSDATSFEFDIEELKHYKCSENLEVIDQIPSNQVVPNLKRNTIYTSTESDIEKLEHSNSNQILEVMHQIPSESSEAEEPAFQLETIYVYESFVSSDETPIQRYIRELDHHQQIPEVELDTIYTPMESDIDELDYSKCNQNLEVIPQILEFNQIEEPNFQHEYEMDSSSSSNSDDETNIEHDIEMHQIPSESSQIEEPAFQLETIYVYESCANSDVTPIQCYIREQDHHEIPEVEEPMESDIEELEHSQWNQNIQIEEPSFQLEYVMDSRSKSSTDNEKPIECDMALKHFKPQHNLKVIHQIQISKQTENQEEETNYKCDRCGNIFALSISLQIHKDLHHPIFKCYQCYKQFALRSSLKIHEENHDNIKIFKCDLCESQYGLRSSLKLHKQSHEIY